MRYESYPLNVKAEVANGDPLDVEQFVNVVVVLIPGAMVGTTIANKLQIQGSQTNDGDDWTAIGDPVSEATAAVAVDGAWSRLRIATTEHNSGTPSARISAHNVRTN